MMDFLDELQARVLPADGAMGTELLAAGVPPGTCLEALTVSDPDRVRAVHEQYLAAGARVLRTNTFGANAARLAAHGFEHRVGELNWSAAQLARDVARGHGVYVAGSVGPAGVTSASDEWRGISLATRHSHLSRLYTDQIGALLDGGCQLIVFETFRDPTELLVALAAKQALHHCPAVCLLALEDPALLAAAWEKLRAADAEVVGLNCLDPTTTTRLFQAPPEDHLLAAFPSAGLPRGNRYDFTPAQFATAALALTARGVRLIGGCCGIGPAHIAALAGDEG